MTTRVQVSAGVGLIFSYLLGAHASGAPPVPSAIGVSPARLVARVEAGDWLPPIRVWNRGSAAVTVGVSWAWGTHDPTGALVLVPPSTTTDGAAGLTIAEPTLRLGPGEEGLFRARVHTPAGYSGALFPVLLLTPRSGAPAWFRVAVPLVLRIGTPGPPRFDIEELEIEPGKAAGSHRIVVSVRNRGERDGAARVELRLVGPEGTPAGRISLPPARILPGLSRRWEVAWTPRTPVPGRYRLSGAVNGAEQLRSVAFHLPLPRRKGGDQRVAAVPPVS